MQETSSNESAAMNMKKTVAMENTAEEHVANESAAITNHCDISIECMGNAAVKQTLQKEKWSQKVKMVEPKNCSHMIIKIKTTP